MTCSPHVLCPPLKMFLPPSLEISNPGPLNDALPHAIQLPPPPPPPPQTFSMFCFAPLVIFSEINPECHLFPPVSTHFMFDSTISYRDVYTEAHSSHTLFCCDDQPRRMPEKAVCLANPEYSIHWTQKKYGIPRRTKLRKFLLLCYVCTSLSWHAVLFRCAMYIQVCHGVTGSSMLWAKKLHTS